LDKGIVPEYQYHYELVGSICNILTCHRVSMKEHMALTAVLDSYTHSLVFHLFFGTRALLACIRFCPHDNNIDPLEFIE
jgi:hypothetical protein